MASQPHQPIDEALDRIEDAILPCITMLVDTLLDAAEAGSRIDPHAYAAALRTLALEIETLTHEIEDAAPDCDASASAA